MSEIAFLKWVGKEYPYLTVEDWSIPIVHRDKGKKVLQQLYPDQKSSIEKWESMCIQATPDFKLKVKESGKYICWIDVKNTSKIDNPFNLNWDKHYYYLTVSIDTNLSAYIIVFLNNEEFPRMWGYLDPKNYKHDSHIPLHDISEFEQEIKRLISRS